MTKKPDKFGSPYDPSNKMAKPEKETLEPENHGSITGCGQIGCPICMPSAGYGPSGLFGGGGSPSGRGDGTYTVNVSGSGGGGSMDVEQLRAIMQVYGLANSRMLDKIFIAGDGKSYYSGSGGSADPQKPVEPAKPKPSAAYIAARKEVEDWITPAPTQSFSDIIGNDEALEQLRDAIQAPIKYKELYEAYGMKMPKGALLSGPPGCGKTMFARAAASEMKTLYGDAVEFLSIQGTNLQSPYVGVTEGYISAIFTYAREYKNFHGHPLLVFLDEAEALLPDRTGRIRRVSPWEESQVATFLAEMDGIQESGAFILLATNRPEVIDQALLRDGRCDFKIKVKRPNQEAVAAILFNNFQGTFIGEGDRAELINAALESLYDPHKILMDAAAIGFDAKEVKFYEGKHKHFLLEHILSGAMAASIPMRATRYAFARDKTTGVPLGVTIADVVRAVNDLFEENKGLEHSFAMEEFRQMFMAELEQK